MKVVLTFILCLILPFIMTGPAHAFVQPDEAMQNPKLEQRARYLYSQLRCVTCDSQSIAGSEADMARALRALVRERLRAGDSNDEVIAYVRERYGDTVLMRPPVTSYTWFLWGLPVLMLIAGLVLMRDLYRRPA